MLVPSKQGSPLAALPDLMYTGVVTVLSPHLNVGFTWAPTGRLDSDCSPLK